MSTGEWDSLLWYEHRMYLEGFEEEGLIQRNDNYSSPQPSPAGLVAQRTRQEGNVAIVESDHHYDLSGDVGEFAAVGLREETL